MLYDSEASGCGMMSHGGGESLDSVSAKQPFTDTLTALKSVEENRGWSANYQEAGVVVWLEHLPISSSVAAMSYYTLIEIAGHDSGLQNDH